MFLFPHMVKNQSVPGRFQKLALAGELGDGHFDVVLHSFWIPHGYEHAVGCLGRGLAQYMTSAVEVWLHSVDRRSRLCLPSNGNNWKWTLPRSVCGKWLTKALGKIVREGEKNSRRFILVQSFCWTIIGYDISWPHPVPRIWNPSYATGHADQDGDNRISEEEYRNVLRTPQASRWFHGIEEDRSILKYIQALDGETLMRWNMMTTALRPWQL